MGTSRVSRHHFHHPLRLCREKVLGFGVSLSPNVAQRFAEAIVATFRSRFDEEEEMLFAQLLDPVSHQCAPYNVLDALTTSGDGWTNVCRWIHERRRLTVLTGRNQLRTPHLRPVDRGHSFCVRCD